MIPFGNQKGGDGDHRAAFLEVKDGGSVVRFLRRLLTRIGNFVTGRSDEQRLREEMEEHIALQAAENLGAGMSSPEARRQAVLKFGAREGIRESYHAEQGLPFLETLLQDVRYALRLLAKSPGFAAVAILTMALGIGATTAIFSLVDATLLHPLSYPHPEQLVRIEDDLPGIRAEDAGISIPESKDLERSGIFQFVVLQGFGSVNLTGSSQPSRIQFEPVSPGYFALLGIKPELGRTFYPEDPTPGFTLDVVISDGLWKRAFGGDPKIAARQRFVSCHRRHAGWFSRSGTNTGAKEYRVMGRHRFRRRPGPAPDPQLAVVSGNHCATETWTDDCSGAEPLGCIGGVFAETIPGRLSGRKRMEGAISAPQRERVRQCSAVVDIAVGRGGIGAAYRLRERGESAAGARQRERTRDGGSPGARRRTESASAAVAHRERASFSSWRNGRCGDSVLHQKLSAANVAGEPSAAP